MEDRMWADCVVSLVLLMLLVDIIALLIITILMIASCFFWERHVINNTSRPPLIRLKLFTRASGRPASVYAIGFISWMGLCRESHLVIIQMTD